MNSFYMNGYLWNVVFVDPDSPKLVDRTGTLRVATTDPTIFCVFVSVILYGEYLKRVLIHELGHCCMVSYNLLDDIHVMVKPEYWMDAEEWVCNFIADYGMKIFDVAYSVIGHDAWKIVPKWIEKIVA